MEIRFFLDPETRQPHIYEHGVIEEEVRQILLTMETTSEAKETHGTSSARLRLGVT